MTAPDQMPACAVLSSRACQHAAMGRFRPMLASFLLRSLSYMSNLPAKRARFEFAARMWPWRGPLFQSRHGMINRFPTVPAIATLAAIAALTALTAGAAARQARPASPTEATAPREAGEPIM